MQVQRPSDLRCWIQSSPPQFFARLTGLPQNQTLIECVEQSSKSEFSQPVV